MNELAETLNLDSGTLGNILTTAALLTVILVLRALALRYLGANVEDSDAQYRARKVVNYTVTVLFLVTLAFIWIEAFDNLPTYLGLVSAGIAIALADVLKNMAGWAFILTRRPFQVGDRIEVTGLIGDVVDIRLFRFSLMEVGGWVDADQSTGRLVHVPNGVVFTQAVSNYTEGFAYVWDELSVLVTFESDWRLGERLLRSVLADHAPDVEGAAGTMIRETARRYSIRIGTLTPIVYVSVKDSGVMLSARYLVEARSRRAIADRLWRSTLEALEMNPTVVLAYPTIRTHLVDTVRLDRG